MFCMEAEVGQSNKSCAGGAVWHSPCMSAGRTLPRRLALTKPPMEREKRLFGAILSPHKQLQIAHMASVTKSMPLSTEAERGNISKWASKLKIRHSKRQKGFPATHTRVKGWKECKHQTLCFENFARTSNTRLRFVPENMRQKIF